MSILTLGSNNPNFSHIIAKNPATIAEKKVPFKREIRKGVVHGWFTKPDNQEFRLFFKDAETQISFGNGEVDDFEYLDCTRYGSPYLPIAIITNALASASKGDSEQDVIGYLAYVECNIKVPRVRFLEQLVLHYQGVATISYELLSGHYYKVRVEAPLVHTCLNVLQVICILECMSDPDTFVRLDTSSINKFIGIFNKANTPYYPRYLFQMKAISNKEMFDKVRKDLTGENMILFYGDTRQQRFDALRKELQGGDTLIDIGCGELFQTLKLSSKYDQVFAVDADEDRSWNNSEKVKARKIENISVVNAFANEAWVKDTEGTFTGADVLLTEVLEHIPREESDTLLKSILSTDFRKVVVTCPNKDFNQHYYIPDDAMRHPDHKWEPTFEEFCDDMVIFAAEAGPQVYVTIKGIGDEVNGISTSIMAVFTKEDLNEPNNQNDAGAGESN